MVRGKTTNEEEAIRTLLRGYLLAEIAKRRREVKRFERSYGLDFQHNLAPISTNVRPYWQMDYNQDSRQHGDFLRSLQV